MSQRVACDASGKPYPGSPAGAGIPRYSHPGFRKAAVTYMNKMFEAIPDLAAMAIGPQDGGVIMLDARDDANLYGKPADSLVQKTSNYMCDFMMFLAKELKKSHPDKYLIYTLLCAANADVVPNNVEEFPDNVILSFVSFQSAYMASENSLMQAKLDNRKQWLAKMRTGNKGPFWDYFLYYSYNRKGHGMNGEPCSPVFFTDYLQRSMQEMRPYSDGKFMEIVEEKCQVDGDKNPRYRLRWPGLMHLMVYWQSKLFWDPDMDRKKMLDEYYDLFFGPARAEMKEFYEFAEDVWTRQEWSVIPNNALKQKDVERYFDILKRAHDKAGKDTVYDKRISQIEGEMPKRSGPRIEAYRAPEPVKIDGDLDKYPAAWRVPLRNLSTGELPATNKTEAIIALAPDGSSLIVGVTCYENKMDKLRASCTLNDNAGIFNDDAVEVYVNTPERSYISSYFKIVVNPNGAIWDESTDVAIVGRDTLLTENDSLRILWNPGTRAVVKKYDDRWTAEILIPTKDFGKSGPTESSPWGIQVGRTRFTGGSGVMVSAIAPTAAGYATLNRWGFLYMK